MTSCCLYGACTDVNGTNHGEADIGLLERRSVVGTITRDCDHLAVGIQATVDDALDQSVLVLRRRASQHTQLRPDLVDQVLLRLAQATPATFSIQIQFYYASALVGHFGIARSVRLSVPWRSCQWCRHAGCLQLSHRRPPEMCGLRTVRGRT